jgi:N-acetylneuraminic acid mutarotase
MPLKCMLAPFAIALLGGSAAFARKLVWKDRATLPLPRSGYMAGVIDGKYVVAGGSYWVGQQKHWTADVEVFDPLRNCWSKAQPLPQPRSDAASVVYDGDLYVFGGDRQSEAHHEALKFRAGKWTAVPAAELPESRIGAVTVVSQGAIYLIGGMSKAGDYSTASSSLWVWNPNSPGKGWQDLPPIPGPGLITHATAVVNGKIYVVGGATNSGQQVANVRTVFEFNPETNQWKQLGDLPISRRAWWGLGLSNEILLLGGYTTAYEQDVFAYQLPSGTLVNIGSIPFGVCDARFLRVRDSIIGTGGEVRDKVRGNRTIEAHLG